MSDIMHPMSFGHLVKWIMNEYKQESSIFGIKHIINYCNHENDSSPGTLMPIFQEYMEAPFGPAAGPHTQLAQNIVSAYVAGARFFELKTVQAMDGDELRSCIEKPCIAAPKEGYNCEWSTELTVSEAYEEYVKAWIICKILARELGLGHPDGFVFHMSVGYDLAGIQSAKIDDFINHMMEAGQEPIFQECISWALAHLSCFQNIDEDYLRGISSKISTSVTLSTLHGCPAHEIEKIAAYLLKEKHLHTYIKCNPTLLGYDFVRKTLDQKGYQHIHVDKNHFFHDLKWKDAIRIFRNLLPWAREHNLLFGAKLSNTLPVHNDFINLPARETYMSGSALLPFTLHLTSMFLEEFSDSMSISYSGGASQDSIFSLLEAGTWPVTMATNLLKPGGYERLSLISDLWKNRKADFVKKHSLKAIHDFGNEQSLERIDQSGIKHSIDKIQALEEEIHNDLRYSNSNNHLSDRSIHRNLPLFDCFTAPCRFGCPIGQDIPAYIDCLEQEQPELAFEIILERNPLPHITASICNHPCNEKCMRNYYEGPVSIRDLKMRAIEEGYSDWKIKNEMLLARRADKKVIIAKQNRNEETRIAIVGGGPAGLAAAAFLSRQGLSVTIFEKRSELGGIPRHVIPEFRIPLSKIQKDIDLCLSWGVNVILNREIMSLRELKNVGFDHIILATGAWNMGNPQLKYGHSMDALEFLSHAKANPSSLSLGRNVFVLGDGNTAMDVARLAKRTPSVANVFIVSRLTKEYFPASQEEIDLALEEGVEILENLSPVGIEDGILTCQITEIDPNYKPQPQELPHFILRDTIRTFPADSLIAAVGQQVDDALFKDLLFEKYNDSKLAGSSEILQNSNLSDISDSPTIHVIGDAQNGPATIVDAIASAQKVASDICGCHFDRYEEYNRRIKNTAFSVKNNQTSTKNRPGSMKNMHHSVGNNSTSHSNCLACSSSCNVCMQVCPNRANVSIYVPGRCQNQILHLDGPCNECGNCASFCPYEGAPYKDKFTLFWSKEDFLNSDNPGFWISGDDLIYVRINQELLHASITEIEEKWPDIARFINSVQQKYSYLFP